jgi:hypothetical protein
VFERQVLGGMPPRTRPPTPHQAGRMSPREWQSLGDG